MRRQKGSIVDTPNGAKRIFVSAGYDPITGKRRRVTKVVRGTARQAESEWLGMELRQGHSGIGRELMTLNDFFDGYYIKDKAEKLKPSTVEGYEAKYRQFIRNSLGLEIMSKITPVMVNNWLGAIEGDSKKFNAFKLLRQVMRSARRLDLMDDCPCDRVEIPKDPSTYEPDVLRKEDVPIYIEHFGNDKLLAPAVLIALGCGLRRSELVALDWRDISRDGTITIDDAIVSVRGKATEGAPKSRFSTRVVHMPSGLMERLEAFRKPDDEPVLQSVTGMRINPDNLSGAYSAKLKSLPDGVKRVSLKNLRHTSLSLALEAGVELINVSRRAGHSSVEITSRYYLRPDESVDKAAADKMNDIFGF